MNNRIKLLERRLNILLRKYDRLLELKQSTERDEWLRSRHSWTLPGELKYFQNNDNKGTLDFMINSLGYYQDIEDVDTLHASCFDSSKINQHVKSDPSTYQEDYDTLSEMKEAGLLGNGIKRISEPCGLENKNIRNTETGRIGFVAPDGTLQIYPENTTPDKIANCPNSAPIDISNADFEAFPSKINLSEQQPCKTVRQNRIHERLKEIEQRIKNTFKILKEEIDAEIKAKKERGEGEVTTPVDQQLVDRISELSEVNNALKLSNQDVQSLEGIETVADIMRIFSFYRIFMWFILVLIGLSIVYSIYRNGGKMSFLSAFFFGSLIATWVYFNLNMILRIPPLSWFFGPTFQF